MGLLDKFRKQIATKIKPILERGSAEKFETAKDFILLRVRNHNVCRELENKTAPSSYFSTSDGTLFGFMGFEAARNPAQELISYLDRNITSTQKFNILKICIESYKVLFSPVLSSLYLISNPISISALHPLFRQSYF